MCHHACYVQCTQEYNKSVVDNKVSHRMKMEKIEKTHNEKNISSCYVTNQFTSYCPKNQPPFWLCTAITSSKAFSSRFGGISYTLSKIV